MPDTSSTLLAGESQEGSDERAALEEELGAIEDIAIVATIVDDGELRTYVIVSSADDSMMLWYALDDAGGIAAVEVPDVPPSRVLVPTADGFRAEDPTGTSPAVTVQFDDDRVLVIGPAGTKTARVAA